MPELVAMLTLTVGALVVPVNVTLRLVALASDSDASLAPAASLSDAPPLC